MSKTFALLAAVATIAMTSPFAFAVTADSAPPGYTTWTSTPAAQVQPVAHQAEKSMAQAPAVHSGYYNPAQLNLSVGS